MEKRRRFPRQRRIRNLLAVRNSNLGNENESGNAAAVAAAIPLPDHTRVNNAATVSRGPKNATNPVPTSALNPICRSAPNPAFHRNLCSRVHPNARSHALHQQRKVIPHRSQPTLRRPYRQPPQIGRRNAITIMVAAAAVVRVAGAVGGVAAVITRRVKRPATAPLRRKKSIRVILRTLSRIFRVHCRRNCLSARLLQTKLKQCRCHSLISVAPIW